MNDYTITDLLAPAASILTLRLLLDYCQQLGFDKRL